MTCITIHPTPDAPLYARVIDAYSGIHVMVCRTARWDRKAKRPLPALLSTFTITDMPFHAALDAVHAMLVAGRTDLSPLLPEPAAV
jgi:hypothetical protein